MNVLNHAADILTLALVLQAVAGIGIFWFGRMIPRGGDGLAALIIAGVGVTVIYTQRQWGWAAEGGVRQWFVPVELGMSFDVMGLLLTFAMQIVALYSLLVPAYGRRGNLPHRIQGGILIAAAGVSLVWLAVSTWTATLGLAAVVVAGMMSFSASWELASEFALAARYGWERMMGLFLITAGLGEGLHPAGYLLVLMGLLPFMSVIPFMKIAVTESSQPTLGSLYLTLWAPAVGALAVFFRLAPGLTAIGWTPALGIVFASLSVIAMGAAFVQQRWQAAGSSAFVAYFCWVGASLCWGGTLAFASFLLTGLTAGVGWALMMDLKEDGAPGTKLAAIAAAIWAGAIGFLNYSGMGTLLSGVATDAGLFVGLCLTWFAFTLLCARLAVLSFEQSSGGHTTKVPPSVWSKGAAIVLLILAGTTLLWTGRILGPSPWNVEDQVATNHMANWWGPGATGDITSAFVAQWTLWVLGLGLGALFALRSIEGVEGMRRRLPRFTRWVANGYSLERAMSWTIARLAQAGRALNRLDDRSWESVLPRALGTFVTVLSRQLNRLSLYMDEGGANQVRALGVVPGKVLQLIQGGDVRWYVFFGVGSGLALLVHFLKF